MSVKKLMKPYKQCVLRLWISGKLICRLASRPVSTYLQSPSSQTFRKLARPIIVNRTHPEIMNLETLSSRDLHIFPISDSGWRPSSAGEVGRGSLIRGTFGQLQPPNARASEASKTAEVIGHKNLTSTVSLAWHVHIRTTSPKTFKPLYS